MFSEKRTAYISAAISAALLSVLLGGCCANTAARDYHRIPYCCDRTAGAGTEIYCAEPGRSTAMREQTPPPQTIEPAAGDVKPADEVFSKAGRK